MDLTPETIEAISKASIGIIVAFGGIVSTIVSGVVGYFTWKTRYEVDRLYATTYRPNEDGTPGKMRKHPKVLVKLFTRKHVTPSKEAATDEKPIP